MDTNKDEVDQTNSTNTNSVNKDVYRTADAKEQK